MLQSARLEVAHPGYTERVFTETRTGGASIRVVANHLDGSAIHGCDDAPILRWRMAPTKIGAPGRLGDNSPFMPFGKLMFFPAGVPYSTRRFTEGEENRLIICRFENELNTMLSDLDSDWRPANLERCLDIKCGRIELAVQRLYHEVAHPGFASELLLDGLLTSIAVDLTRYFREEAGVGRVSSARIPQLTPAQLNRITEFITTAREGCPTAAQVAELCGLGRSSFQQRFKLTTGQSLHAYVEQVRLARAKAFLTDTGMSMKGIAYELGFTHQATFTSSFHRATGMSPTQYRFEHRNRSCSSARVADA